MCERVASRSFDLGSRGLGMVAHEAKRSCAGACPMMVSSPAYDTKKGTDCLSSSPPHALRVCTWLVMMSRGAYCVNE